VLRGKDKNMTAHGYLEQKTARPLSFGGVVLLHGAAIAAVLLIKGPGWERAPDIPTTVVNVKRHHRPGRAGGRDRAAQRHQRRILARHGTPRAQPLALQARDRGRAAGPGQQGDDSRVPA
jgi:hypothetical protein